jgi:hypothetical protein
MSNTTGTKFPLSDWQVQSLRLTAFPSPSAQIADQNWWAEITGELPESKTSQPRTGQQLQTGSYKNGQLVLSVRSNRIDWQYAAVQKDSEEELIIPILGSFPECLDVFSELMNNWFALPSMPLLVRLAFGAVLAHPVRNFSEGHEFLQRYSLPEFNLEGTSDFLYQISRQNDSNIGVVNLKINRLSKWAMSVVQNILVSFTAGQLSTLPTDFQAFAATLELDINTVPDVELELNQNILPKLFDELINFGSEIAQEGDIV